MKTHSDFLFRLIQSLSPSEKRYFKLYASRHVLGNKNNYLKLFEVINQQTAYDETKLKRSLKDETMLRHFSTAKTRLKEMILDALDDYERKNAPQEQVKKQLHQASLLASKGFKKEATRLLEKVQKRAVFLEALEVALMATKMKTSMCDLKGVDLKIQLKEEKYYAFLIQNQSIYNSLHYQAYQLNYQWNLKNIEECEARFEKIMEHPFLKEKSKALTFRAKMQYFDIQVLYCERVKNDFLSSYSYQKARLEMFEEYEERLKIIPTIYYMLKVNFFNTCEKLSKHQEIVDGLSKLIQTARRYGFYKSSQFQDFFFPKRIEFLFKVCRATRQYKKGLRLVSELVNVLEKHDYAIKPYCRLTLYLNAVYFHFIHKQYADALTWIAEILNEKPEVGYRDLISLAHIFQVVIHYELGNANFVLSLIRTYQRQINKQGTALKIELMVLKYIGRLAKTVDKSREYSLLQKFRLELKATLGEHFTECVILSYFPAFQWIEGQLLGKALKEMLSQGKVLTLVVQ